MIIRAEFGDLQIQIKKEMAGIKAQDNRILQSGIRATSIEQHIYRFCYKSGTD